MCLIIIKFVGEMTEKRTYTWKINIITNKNNKKKISINQNASSIESAITNILADILKLSRYGIPCYIVDNKNKKYRLAYIDNKNMNDEYYEITSLFLNTISNVAPDITSPNATNPKGNANANTNANTVPSVKNHQNTTQLNANAKPFFPIAHTSHFVPNFAVM